MDMVRFGRGIRALRKRRGWRQVDLAAQAGVSQSIVSRVERGLGGRLTVETLARVAHVLGSRVDVRLSWQGEGLDRLLDHDHARLAEVVTRLLRDAGWEVRTEVTFWVRGERGSVDVLAWHEASATVLVIEIKSVVPDVQATLSTFDRKARLGVDIAATVGWHPNVVARLLVIDASRTSRRRVEAHAATFEAALPHRFMQVRRYLQDPRGEALLGHGEALRGRGEPLQGPGEPLRGPGEPLRGLMFVSGSPGTPVRHRQPSPGRRARA